jgi:hypothetical protein
MQNVEKLVNVYDLNMGKRRLLEDIVMMVLSDDVFCVSLEGAVNKLIIVRVCCNQMEMIINLNHFGVGKIKQGFDDIGSNL